MYLESIDDCQLLNECGILSGGLDILKYGSWEGEAWCLQVLLFAPVSKSKQMMYLNGSHRN